jgi:lipoprotein-anchoring transpeptidase ErfK/SrfK
MTKTLSCVEYQQTDPLRGSNSNVVLFTYPCTADVLVVRAATANANCATRRLASPTAIGVRGDEDGESARLSARLQRQIVGFPSHAAPGTIIIDTPNTFLYYILGNGRAIRYGIGVGREGLYLVRRKERRPQSRVAGLVSTGADDCTAALFAAYGRRRPRQSARRACHIHWRHRIPHSRH